MAQIDYRELTHMIESDGLEQVSAELRRYLEKRELSWRDFSIRDLAEAVCGREWVANMHPRYGSDGTVRQLMEADAVKYSQFSNITGQILFSATLEKYEDEEFVFSRAIPDRDSDILDVEKIPGISRIGDEALVVEEGKAYPRVGVSEDYVELAAKKKRGFICDLTKESVIGDRTGFLAERCGEGGFFLGLNKEKRLIDAVIDGNTGAGSIVVGGHRYHWKGTSYGTYQTTTPWNNVTTSNALVDWTDFDAAWQTLAALTDPYTGEPILIQPNTVIVANSLAWTAKRILSATEVRYGDTSSATGSQTIGGNPVPAMMNGLNVLTSRLFTARVSAASQLATTWYLANMRAWVYSRIWDITTAQRGAGTDAEFENDVIMQFKASEMGVAGTVEPRLAHRSTAA